MNNFFNNIIQIKILAYNDEINKFDAKNQNITNVSKPTNDLDAINFLTLKDYCFKNYNNILETLKKDINRLFEILKYTNIDSLEFSKLNLEDDLKEKIIYLKNLIVDNTQLLNEFIYKYNSLEKKTTLLEFKKICLENKIDELQEQIINLQNDRLNKNKLTYVQEDIKIMYNQLKEFFNSLHNNTKLNFDKVYIDINFLNDKYTEHVNLITSNRKKIDNIILNNQNSSEIVDNCLYKIILDQDNISTDSKTLFINNIPKSKIIKNFINSKIYDDVRLCKIKYIIDYYNEKDEIISETYYGNVKLIIDKNTINLSSETYITNLQLTIEENFIESVTLNNVFKNNKKIKYILLHINLIFRIKLF